MRILHIIPTYIPAWRYGGPIRSVHGLCKKLAEKGHEVHVYTTNVDGPNELNVELCKPVEVDGVFVSYFPVSYIRRIYYSPLMSKALSTNVKNFDVVHLHSVFLWPTWKAATLAKIHHIPYILAPRGMLVNDLISSKSTLVKKLWISIFEKSNIENASAIHVTSDIEELELLKFKFKLPPVVTIPNGIDDNAKMEQPSQPIPIPNKGTYLLYIGRVNWKKGLDRLIASLKYIPNIYLVVAGNDEESYTCTLNQIAIDNGVDGRVSFVGEVRGNVKTDLIQNCMFLVLPSYSENFGNVILESMLEGVPVAVTKAVGLSSIIAESGTGVILPESPEGIGETLTSYLSNDSAYDEMCGKCKPLIKNQFSWDAVSGSILELYKKLIINNAGAL